MVSLPVYVFIPMLLGMWLFLAWCVYNCVRDTSWWQRRRHELESQTTDEMKE